MKIGLISDTHDNLPMIDKAAKRLNEEKVELVLHAGDYVAGFAVERLMKQLKPHMIGVFGNNDGDRELLARKFAGFSHAEIRGDFAEIVADGLKIALLHGHVKELLRSLINSESYDIIVYGHTHKTEDYKHGKTLVVNPGEVCGYLYENSTAAIFDTLSKQTRVIEL